MENEVKDKRGGARPGAGRKSCGRKLVTTSFSIPVDSAAKLKRISEETGKPRWQILTELIDKL